MKEKEVREANSLVQVRGSLFGVFREYKQDGKNHKEQPMNIKLPKQLE